MRFAEVDLGCHLAGGCLPSDLCQKEEVGAPSDFTVSNMRLPNSFSFASMPRTHLRSVFCAIFVIAGVSLTMLPIARAQLMYNNGATIVTKLSSYVQVNGAYENESGSIDDSGTVTITSDFTNIAAAIAGGSGLYNIAGNFTNNGTFIKKTGTVNLDGTSNQNVGGTTITTFYDLQFTNGGSKTLTQQEVVDSNCYFNNGICYTTQTDVLHFDVNGNWVNIWECPLRRVPATSMGRARRT